MRSMLKDCGYMQLLGTNKIGTYWVITHIGEYLRKFLLSRFIEGLGSFSEPGLKNVVILWLKQPYSKLTNTKSS